MKKRFITILGLIFQNFFGCVHALEEPLVVVLMVKNEEVAMRFTLQPFLEGGIQSYLILDTGSTDKTIQVVQDLFKKHKITQGYIIEQPFVDFATSRNYALKCAEDMFPQAAFMLMVDAEWEIQGVKDLIQFCYDNKDTSCNVYGIKMIMKNTEYFMYKLMRMRRGIRYQGPVHEFIVADSMNYVPDSVYFSYNPTEYGEKKSNQRFLRDLEILLQEYDKNPSDARNLFFLAQTYACLNDWDNARKYYTLRCDLQGNPEEDFMACYRLGMVYKALGKWPSAIEYALKAYNLRPSRAEPLVMIAQYYISTESYFLAYLFAQQACALAYPRGDILYVEQEAYTYTRYDIMSHAASYVGDYEEGEKATIKALQVYPEKKHLRHNLNAYRELKKSKQSYG